MVAWSVFKGSDAAWDEARLALEDHCVFQSSGWAAHKAAAGWTPLRLIAKEAAAQFLVKKMPGGARLLWSRGGPSGAPETWNEGLRAAATQAAGGLAVYGRICSYREDTSAQAAALTAAGWKKPARPLNRPESFTLDLSGGEEALRGGLSSNWAHNLRRGLKRCAVRLWENPKPADVIAVYREMEAYKGIGAAHDEDSIGALLKHLAGAITLWRADDENGRAIALRACAVENNRGWDLLAASGEAGRKSYASYALFWSLLVGCAARGVKRYDLGGADPEKAKGVYDFKKGTGASPVAYLGEWDWANPAWSRKLAGAAVSRLAGSA